MLKKNGRQLAIILFATLLSAAILILALAWPKVGLHIAINRLHHPLPDQLFRYWTYLGDGTVMLLPVLLAFVFYSYRKGLFLLFAYLLAGLGSQFMKRIVWPDELRPVSFFELNVPDYHLHLVEGVKMHHLHSFPSGHTATAFALFLALALLTEKAWLRYFLILLATGVGLSRVWLSQHFMVDVGTGALWGTCSAVLSWLLVMKVLKGERLDSSLLATLKTTKTAIRK